MPERERAVMQEYRTIFYCRYYVEVQDNRLPQQQQANAEMMRLARVLSLPLVATNDCHYLFPGDAEAHEVLLCIQTGKTLGDEKRWRFGTDQLYVKAPEEMRRAFPECSEAIDNTLDIARRCKLELTFGKYQFPAFCAPGGEDLDAYLHRKARAGRGTRVESAGGWRRKAISRQEPGRVAAGAEADWPSSAKLSASSMSSRSSIHRRSALRWAGMDRSFWACSSEETRQ